MQSIADFAEGMILGELESPSKRSTSYNSREKDISTIEVPSNYRSRLVESAISNDHDSIEIPVPEPEEVPEVEPDRYDIEALNQDDIVKKLESLLNEFKEVLSEMTSAGMLGTAGGGQQKAPEVPKVKHLQNTNPWEKPRKKKIRLVRKK